MPEIKSLTEPLALCRRCTFASLCLPRGWNDTERHARKGGLWRRWHLVQFYQKFIHSAEATGTDVTKRMRCMPQDV